MNEETDNTQPKGQWEFDAEVTQAFDDMLRRSIPQYEVMRTAVFNLGCKYIQRSTDIVDLGCSRGEAFAPFIDKFGVSNRYIGIEVSEAMLTAARERFAGFIKTGYVDIRNFDLRTGYPPVRASLTLSVLTLQFTPIEYRQRILRDIFKSTTNGGALILVEKVLGGDAELDAQMVDLYYQLKGENGYTQDSIDRKRHSLEGVLVPVTAAWNEELLRQAGFQHVDCFWRWMNFAGWVAVKD